MYLTRKHTDMSFPEIGRFMGNKNHSTVILANRKIEKLWQGDELVTRQTPAGDQQERLREIIAKIEEQLGMHRQVAHAGLKQSRLTVQPKPTIRPPAKINLSQTAVG
jgi:hypothetical protein